MDENEEDIFELDESDFVDTPTTEEQENVEKVDAKTKQTREKTASTNEQLEETEDKKFLDYLNNKGIKYNGEAVKIEKIDDLINTYQKGLNYDNLKAKQEKSENIVMNYVSNMAKKANLTPEQYIEKVKKYEEEQIKAQNENAIQSMMSNGIPEDIAREVIETRALRESLQRQQTELNEKEEARKAELQKEKEYEEFLNAYPGIEVDKIPKEVFENAKNSNLKSAYAEYENKILKEKIKQMEQNQNNASNSVVSPTSNGSSTEQQSKDAFLDGFDSI